MATVGQMISDLELRFTAGKPSDDFEGSREQLRFWIDSANGALLPKWIIGTNWGVIPQNALRRIDCMAVVTDTPVCVGGCSSYIYIQFPKNDLGNPVVPMTLESDSSIVMITKGDIQIYRVPSPEFLQTMTDLRGGSTTPYFYRIKDKIYIFNGVYPSYTKLTVFAGFSDSSFLKDDDVYPTVEELIPAILDNAEKIGIRQFQAQNDLQDDGKAK